MPQPQTSRLSTTDNLKESETKIVLRANWPNLAEGMDPTVERHSITRHPGYRKGGYVKPWSSQETDMFFLAINMVGTDFTIISSLFPHRTRTDIKNKFKKEERTSGWRIDKALKEKPKMDMELFPKLLENIRAMEQDTSTKRVKEEGVSTEQDTSMKRVKEEGVSTEQDTSMKRVKEEGVSTEQDTSMKRVKKEGVSADEDTSMKRVKEEGVDMELFPKLLENIRAMEQDTSMKRVKEVVKEEGVSNEQASAATSLVEC